MALRPNYCATVGAAAVWLLILSGSALGQDTTLTSLRGDSTVKVQTDSISLRLLDVDIRTAIQALGRYLDRPVVFGSIGTARVTLETPKPVPRGEALSLLRGVLDANNLELHEDSGYLRVSVREQTRVRTPGSGQPDQLQFYTIRLSHARATDVAATVNALYGRASALGEIGERPRTLASELAAARAPIEASPATQAAPRAAVFSGDVVIVPDPRSNSLLVRASESDFELIEAAIKELDIRPLQVLIEVLIAEVRKDRSFDLGTSITLPKTPVSGAANATVEGESGLGLSLGDFALRIMNLGPSSIDATLQAATARGDVSIVSRPIILAANNEMAKILVGSQRPFVQVARSLPTETPSRDQVVQYKDVGTELVVTPTISSDGYIMLELMQEINAATGESVQAAMGAPVISTRSLETRLLMKDGQTVVIGGLADQQRDTGRGGIPILSSIPLVGMLFGRTSRRSIDTELFIFLTPRVIRTDADVDELTTPLRERAEEIKGRR